MGMRRGQNFTKKDVQELEPKEAMYRIPDAVVRGLCIQVTPGGLKSWIIRYRIGRKQNAITIGRFPELNVVQARRKATAVMDRVNNGDDPNKERKEDRAALTVEELAARFIEEHVKDRNKPSTAHEHTRLINRIIIPAIGNLTAKDVDTADIATLLTRIGKKTPTQANRVRAVLSKMFNEAEIWQIRARNSNPVTGQHRKPEKKKDRNLSDKELMALGETLRAIEAASRAGTRLDPKGPSPEAPFPIAAIRLALLTGMRKSEMLGDEYKGIAPMPWSEVSLDENLIRIAPERHKTGAKAGFRPVHLCTAAREILESLPRPIGAACVFPGHLPGRPIVNLLKIWYRVCDAVGKAQEDKPESERVDITDVTLHDLRRTFASVGARMGYPELFLSALLGHAAGTVTQGYARVEGDPLQEVAEAIGGRITAMLNGTFELEPRRQRVAGSPALQAATDLKRPSR